MKFGIYTLLLENFMKRRLIFPDNLNFHFDFGWGNGYILLPPNHPLYGKEYDDIDIKIHGGLTFGEKFNTNNFLEWVEDREIFGDVTIENYEFFKNYWIIGFDTGHSGDDLNTCSFDFVLNETESMRDQCLDDSIEKMKKYKSVYLRKDKLKKIDASVLALSSKQ